ncbi:MAG: HAMP domain-containing sensor histidine kinase [Candidatus Levybacteria bacterium]|nr:HAMP domain-containing sensor histidine kinase [Candidatus Levybacteria bacterium]
MFQSARLKLTAWYLVIIMVISIFFSFAIYTGVNVEFRRFERMQERIKERQDEGLPFNGRPRFNPEVINQARARVITILGIINLSILGIAGATGYFLAGRTLKPIKKMVDEQNRFIEDASHELRTPLTSLRSEIEVGLRNKKLNLENSKMLLQSNLEEVVSLQMLSDNLLELAQTEKSINSFDFTNVSIIDVIDNAIKKLDGPIKEKQIKIEKKVEDVNIPGIQDRVKELFVLLLDNAIKYNPPKSKISIKTERDNGMIKITVKDNGIGIEEEDLPYVFDRFYRASKSRSKEQVSGYGLGLSIAKKIVILHNGTIAIESKINKGTTFVVELPLFS